MNYKGLGIALLISMVPLIAGDPFNYVTWTGSTATTATGNIGGITVTYSSTDLQFVQTGTTASPWNGYSPASTFQSALVNNAPPNAQIVGIDGTSATHTVTFSQAVTNIVMDIVSLGQPALGTQYIFNSPFTILTIGPSTEFGGGTNSLVASAGNTLTGHEGDGILVFPGPLTTLSWTGANPEFWNGFTFGIDANTNSTTATPAPSSLLLIMTGLAAMGLVSFLIGRRRQHAA